MRRFGLLGVLLVGLMSVTFLRPALAAGTFTLDFDHAGTGDLTYTFTVATTGVAMGTVGSGRTGNGGYSTYNGFGSGLYNYGVAVTIDLPSDCNLTNVSFWMQGNIVGVSAYIYGIALLDSSDTVIRGLDTINEFSYDTWNNATFDTSAYADSTAGGKLGVVVDTGTPTSSGASYSQIDDIEITCGTGSGGGRTRPLAMADELSGGGIFDFDYVHSINSSFDAGNRVFAYSENAEANVAAVAAGTVTSITPFTSDGCQTFLALFTFGKLHLCAVLIPGVFTDNGFNNVYTLQMENISKVVIQDAIDPTISYDYYVYKTTLQVNDTVVAGCVIGLTIILKPMPLGIVTLASTIFSVGISGGLGFLTSDTNAGLTFIDMFQDGDFQSLYPSLTEQPSDSDCKEQQLSACANDNPNIAGFAYYDRETDVTLLDGGLGANIPAFNYLMQDNIMVRTDIDYMLTVQARKLETGDDTDHSMMNLQVGDQLDSFNVFPSYRNYTLSLTGDSWRTDNIAKLIVSNQPSSVAPIEVKYICLAPVTASVAPGSCYFANNEFDADASGWDVSATTFGSGEAFMRDGSTMSQTVMLKPDSVDTSHIYTIRAVARLLATGSYTGQIGKSVTLNYTYPLLGDPTEVGTIDSTAVATNGTNLVSGTVELDYPYTLETTIEITTDTTSTFTFSVVVEDTDNYIQGMRIDSVCIDPLGDGTFPGQTGDGGYHPPMIVGCQVVPLPLENSIGPWIFYHWANLRRFFNCDLMKLLNKWFTLFDSFRTTILKVARWWIALVHYGSNWLTSFLWYLNGSFHNIALGQVTTINESGGCHDIFCAVVDVTTTLGNLLSPMLAALNNVTNVLLSIFVSGVKLLFALVTGLVGVVVALLIRLIHFLQMAVNLLIGIVGAFNSSTPTAIPGLPSCAIDPTASPLCAMVWVADNTMFAGRWNIIFTILLSIWAIHLILYAVGEVKRILLETWGSS